MGCKFRNTPTSVGKTHGPCKWEAPAEKHPHERGEDGWQDPRTEDGEETPPRAWGRHKADRVVMPASGNTPTSVGKTVLIKSSSSNTGKHPHERGEDILPCDCRSQSSETPPRAWGRLLMLLCCFSLTRNTPTSVGKTLDFTGVDGGLVEIRFVALSVFQSQGACLKFQ